MNLHFEPVTAENRNAVEKLELLPEQISFIESVDECLGEADSEERWRPVGIYDQETLVGFSMYGCFGKSAADRQVWLDRFLIDRHYQQKGYGKAAVKGLVSRLADEYAADRIYLSVYDINKPAIHLYKEVGFYFNGELDTKGEKVMVLDLQKQ